MSARDKIIRIAKRQCHIISSHFDCYFIHRFNFAFRERASKTREERSPCRPGNASVEVTKRNSIGRYCELLPISYFMVSFSLMEKKTWWPENKFHLKSTYRRWYHYYRITVAARTTANTCHRPFSLPRIFYLLFESIFGEIEILFLQTLQHSTPRKYRRSRLFLFCVNQIIPIK